MKRKPVFDDAIHNLAHRLELALDQAATRVAGRPNRCIAFIAANPREGTSTVARDYAAALNDLVDHKILLIDAGKLDRTYFDALNADPGNSIADAVSAGRPVASALYEIGKHVYLGRWTGPQRERGSASRLLNDGAFWEGLARDFGTIIIDAPSLKASPDGVALAAQADVTAIVVEAEATREPVVENLRDRLVAAGANVAGTVLNKRRFYIPARVYRKM